MPRNISFFLTTSQIRERTKTVTRRLGWKNLKAGTILNGCLKCQGLKSGEPITKLGQIRVTNVRRERLDAMCDSDYGNQEAALEGFPHLSGSEFVGMFCENMKCDPSTVVTRIEFEYVAI